MRATIKLIGNAIKNGSRYTPIRFRAARLASRARPKDYSGQLREVFNDFVRRWRYVKDPTDRELVTISPKQIYETVMGGDNGRGHGDCDDATVAIGSQLYSIGFPVRIATIAPLTAPPGRLMTHVFCQARVPGMGWITVDPVVYPGHGLGHTPPHSRFVAYDLDGNETLQWGNLQGNEEGVDTMLGNVGFEGLGDINQWTDYANPNDYTTPEELLDFRKFAIKDFGIYSEAMGMLPGMGLVAEVETDETGRAWTPMLELAPQDWNYVRAWGKPYHGMFAFGDNGDVYYYDGFAGFFSNLFHKVASGVKKVVGKVKSVAKKVISKIPGGKYLIKLGEKIWGVAKKLVRPLAKFVGKYATKLAPIAAMIPGYGPAIAAGLYTAGKIANIMNKFDVVLTGKEGEVRKVKFKSDTHAKNFEAALKKEAEALKQANAKKQALRVKKLTKPPVPVRPPARPMPRPGFRPIARPMPRPGFRPMARPMPRPGFRPMARPMASPFMYSRMSPQQIQNQIAQLQRLYSQRAA